MFRDILWRRCVCEEVVKGTVFVWNLEEIKSFQLEQLSIFPFLLNKER